MEVVAGGGGRGVGSVAVMHSTSISQNPPNILLVNTLNWKKKKFSNVERPDPKGLSIFFQCTEFLLHRGFKLMSSRSGVRRSN